MAVAVAFALWNADRTSSRATAFTSAALIFWMMGANAAIESGQVDSLQPRRSTGAYKPWAIRKAPFHAVKLCAGITYTMGGIVVDADGRVLDTANKPMTGLYAAGCAAGGVEGGGKQEQVAYVGGLTRSTVFALRVANDIAATLVPA